MDVVLDGSFMLNAMKNKIDFLEQIEQLGLKPKVPREVLQELKDLQSDSKQANRAMIAQLFELLEKRGVKKMTFGAGKVDEQLIKTGKTGVYIATMDSAVRRIVPNKLILSVAQKQVIVERS